MKFIEKTKGIGNLIKNIFKKYPITMIIIYFCSIFMACVIKEDGFIINETTVENLMVFFVIWAIGTFFSEIMFQKRKSKIISYVITGAISGILTFFTINALNYDEMIYRIDGTYIATLILISIYYIMIKLEKELPEYLLDISINILKSTIIYGILAGGFALIFFIFSFLVYDIGTYVLNIEILLLGIYYIPSIINSITTFEETPDFFKKLVKNVLMPLVIATFAIVYIYIIKILVNKTIPSNQIFRILTALFVIGGLIWTYMQSLKDESIMYKISQKIPYIFVPFVCLQIYTLGKRISENGITPLRYTCILIIVFEIIYILMFLIKKNELKKLMFVLVGMLIIALIIPGINISDVSINSQIKRLNNYKNESELTNDDIEKIYGAYNYLIGTTKGRKYIDENYSKEKKEKISNLLYDGERLQNKFISVQKPDSIDISGYSTMKYVIAESSYYGNMENSYSFDTSDYNEIGNVYNIFKDVDLKDQNSEVFLNVDISRNVTDYLKNYDYAKDTANEEFDREIKIDDNETLIINEFEMWFYKDTMECTSYYLSGYVLEK